MPVTLIFLPNGSASAWQVGPQHFDGVLLILSLVYIVIARHWKRREPEDQRAKIKKVLGRAKRRSVTID